MSELPIAGSYRPTVMGMVVWSRRGITWRRWHSASWTAGEMPLMPGWRQGSAHALQIDMVDLAGVAPIIIYLAEEDRVVTISGLGRWPQAASVAYFQKHHGGRIPIGGALYHAWQHLMPGLRRWKSLAR